MLNSLRNSVGTIWAKLLLGLLVAAFAAWGIDGVFAGRQQTVAATVGGAEIDVTEFAREFQDSLTNVRRSTGSNLSAEDARRSGFDRIILERIATRTALDEEARSFGLDVSDLAVAKAIRRVPQFRDAYGKFDKTAYDSYLNRNRLNAKAYEKTIRKDLSRDAMLQTIGNGTTASRALAEALYSYRNEKRSFEHVKLTPDDVDDPGEPSQEALEEFHQENAPRFTAPEFRKLSYVALTVTDVASGIEKSDDALLAEYNARIVDYTKLERRSLEQMVFDTEDEAKAAAAKIKGGESFAKVAEARGLSAEDVSLGNVTKTELPGALSDAAFAPAEAGITDPVGTALGWSLLNVRSIEPEEVTSFEDAKDALRTSMTTIEARQIVPEKSVDLDDQLAGGATLKEAAEATGARYAEIAAVDESGRNPDGERVADLPADPEFLSQIFSTEIGLDPTLIEGAAGDYFALRVEEITEAALRPLDTIESDVAGAWEVAERESALKVLTDEWTTKLEGGEDLAELAKTLDKTVETAGPGTRTDRSLGLSQPLLTALFEADEGDAIAGQAADGLSRFVGRVSAILPATSEEDVAAIDRSTEQYAAGMAQDFVSLFSASARDRHQLIRNEQAIDMMFSGGGYGGYGGHGGM